MTQSRRLLSALAFGLGLFAPAWADGSTKVSIEAQNRDIREVISALARAADVKVRFQPEVRGAVNASIAGKPFEQALTVVAGVQGYRWRLVDGVYHVGRFSEADGDRTVTETIVLTRHDARMLARAFGYVDLEGLGEPAPALDLRELLPPGLDGPPRPLAADRLEATGRAAAVADLRYLIARLESAAAVGYDVLLAWITPERLASLSIYWAKGVMDFGRTPRGESLFSAGDFTTLLKGLRGDLTGLSVLYDGTLPAADLVPVTLTTPAEGGDGQATVRWIGRVESSLGLRIWLKGEVRDGDGPVEFSIDGAPLPPEEGLVLAVRPPVGEPGRIPLLVVMPTVTASGEGR